jgi:antirestriction protein ArdC
MSTSAKACPNEFGRWARVRNSDERDATIDGFLACSGTSIREGSREAYYRPGDDFISLPRFEAFKSAAHFYGTAFHELGHYAGFQIMPISVSTEPDAVASGSTEAANQRDSRKITDRPVAVIRDFTHYGAREPLATHWHCR